MLWCFKQFSPFRTTLLRLRDLPNPGPGPLAPEVAVLDTNQLLHRLDTVRALLSTSAGRDLRRRATGWLVSGVWATLHPAYSKTNFHTTQSV